MQYPLSVNSMQLGSFSWTSSLNYLPHAPSRLKHLCALRALFMLICSGGNTYFGCS